MLPANVYSLANPYWYVGFMTRDEAEGYLALFDAGSFLVRENEGNPGELSVSIMFIDGPHHIKIRAMEASQLMFSIYFAHSIFRTACSA